MFVAKERNTSRLLMGLASFALLILTICEPQLAYENVIDGFRMAFFKVVPAVFPLLVFSYIVAQSPLVQVLGVPLLWYTRLLGIRSRTAATALFVGLLGGFSVLSVNVGLLYQKRCIDRFQAELLLCAGMNIGPAFIVMTVGYGLFHNVAIGVWMFLALLLGNLFSAGILRLLWHDKHHDFTGDIAECVLQQFPNNLLLVSAVGNAVTVCLQLCGFIALFYLLCSIASAFLHGPALIWAGILLEVTNGCTAAVKSLSPYRAYLCLLALSWQGLSIQAQSRALLPKEISLKSFFYSRILAIPCSAVLYSLLIRLFPYSVNTATPVLHAGRFSIWVSVAFAFFVLAFLYECTPKKLFTTDEKKAIM